MKIAIIIICFINNIYSQNIENNYLIIFNNGDEVVCSQKQNDTENKTLTEIAEQFLFDNVEVLRIELSNLSSSIHDSKSKSHHVFYQQYYRGIKVQGGNILVNMDKDNNISFVINNYIPEIKLDISNKLNKTEIKDKIHDITTLNFKNDDVSVLESFIARNPTNNSIQIVYPVIIPSEGNFSSVYLIDGLTGKIITKGDASINYTSSIGHVFAPDPSSYNKTQRDSLSEADINLSYQEVWLTHLNNGGALNGKYAKSVSLASPYDPLITDGNFQLQHDDTGFEEVNIYYHITEFQKYIRTFDYEPKWYNGMLNEEDEIRSEEIRYDASASVPGSAAYYPLDSQEFILFDKFYGSVDAGEDQSPIIHELGHALHDALINNGINLTGLSLDFYYPNTNAIGEGIADYFNISYRRALEAANNNYYNPNHKSNWIVSNIVGIKDKNDANYYSDWTGSSHDKGVSGLLY